VVCQKIWRLGLLWHWFLLPTKDLKSWTLNAEILPWTFCYTFKLKKKSLHFSERKFITTTELNDSKVECKTEDTSLNKTSALTSQMADWMLGFPRTNYTCHSIHNLHSWERGLLSWNRPEHCHIQLIYFLDAQITESRRLRFVLYGMLFAVLSWFRVVSLRDCQRPRTVKIRRRRVSRVGGRKENKLEYIWWNFCAIFVHFCENFNIRDLTTFFPSLYKCEYYVFLVFGSFFGWALDPFLMSWGRAGVWMDVGLAKRIRLFASAYKSPLPCLFCCGGSLFGRPKMPAPQMATSVV